jgi:hypothetical protein
MAWYDDVLAGLRQADNLDDSQRLEAARRIQQGYPEDTAVRIGSGQLPMDEASRMQRAREQGFDVDTTYYHGSPYAGNIDQFKNEFTGKGNDQWGSGFYFTDAPSVANGYASDLPTPRAIEKHGDPSAGVIPVNLAVKNPILLDIQKQSGIRDLPDEYRPNKSQIKQIINSSPYIDDPDNSPLGDWFPEFWEDGKQDWMVDDLAEKYTNAPLDNLEGDFFSGEGDASGLFRKSYADATGYDGIIVKGKDGKNAIVNAFQPNQIRSVNAAFDPEYKGGSLLGLNSNKKPNLISTNPLRAINPEAQSGAYMDAPEDNWVNRIHKATKGFSEVLPLSESGQRDVADFLNTAIEFTPIQSAAELADLGNSVVRGDENPNYMAALGLLDFIPAIGSGGKVANNIFAGSEAAERLGKLEDMKKAESMLDQGVDERKVWSDTGFFRGNDGLMRFEIDDSQVETYRTAKRKLFDAEGEYVAKRNKFGENVSQIQKEFANGMLSEQEARGKIEKLKDELGAISESEKKYRGILDSLQSIEEAPKKASDVLLHDELFKTGNNPNVVLNQLMKDANGVYFPDENKVALAGERSGKDPLSTLMHELQHSVQNTEGFSSGSDPLQIARELQQDSNDALDIVRSINAHMSKALERGDDAAYESLMKERTRALKDVADEYEIINRANAKYKRNLGEAESRLVEKRLNYNPEQRRAIFPYDDLDVPRNELWIGEKGKGNQGVMSIIESINNISNISSNLTDQQKLDRLGKDKAVSYVNGFLANEIPHLKQTIEKLKSGKKTEDYKSRIAEEESWLNRYEKARDYLTRKFPEDFKQEVQKNSKGVEDKFTAEVDSEIESYINDSINEVKENIAYGDISTSEAVNDALNAIEYGLSHKDNSNYFGNAIKENYVKKAVRKRISDALGLKAKE